AQIEQVFEFVRDECTLYIVSFRQRCETPVARASAARRLIRGDRHGWRAAPRPCAGKPQAATRGPLPFGTLEIVALPG
ncbi:MAG TPA: hypothetical protein PLZ74_11325, partial [Kiritimatiellia bacterium]|nr:hypothetical protein [Kiritimatiellia bacterium]